MAGQGTRATDIVIVGSGMGGAAAALRLAEAGCTVTVVERGTRLPAPDGNRNPFIYHRHTLADELAMVGGRSKYYGAALYRFRVTDFEARAHENGMSPAWPLGYDDLAPYYDAAERLYRVHGSAEGDPTDPRRDTPYPHPPLPHDSRVAEVAARLDVPVAAIPRGIDYGPEGSCVLCDACDSHHCRFDAKMDAETATLRPALATGRVTLLSGTDCRRVLLDGAGRRAVGIEIDGPEGRGSIRAGHVIAAGGYPFTPLLLRRSRTTGHEDGIGNGAGWLGRGVGAHSTGQVFPVLGARPLGARHTKTFAINHWFDGDADWTWPLGVVQVAGQTPFWDLTSRLKRPVVRAVAERSLMIFHMTEALPDKETGWQFDGDRLGAFTPPRHQTRSYEELRRRTIALFRKAGYPVLRPRRPTQFWHETGGAIMGDDPALSVTDPFGRVHGVENLVVADATALPSASSVNTGLTIVAHALRAADAVARGRVRAPSESAVS